jgi:hypothetical protein
MKCSGQHLFTPLYLKLSDAMPWPEEEKAFYLLTSDGLFLCRNTTFFRSCVPVTECPSELAGHQPFLKLNYPRSPRRLMEQVIGFFDIIGERYASEAAVLIAWNQTSNAVEVIVPDQVGIVGTSYYGNPYPLELEYEVPPLPPHLVLLGDIHSHVDGLAYASYMDKSDETYRPGLHLVVGRILDEPPQFHCEAIADGVRFEVRDLSMILEGYHQRRVNEVPGEWLNKLTIKPWSSKYRRDGNYKSGSSSGGSTGWSQTGSRWLPAIGGRDDEAQPLRIEDQIDGRHASSPAEPLPSDPQCEDEDRLIDPPASGNRASDPPP